MYTELAVTLFVQVIMCPVAAAQSHFSANSALSKHYELVTGLKPIFTHCVLIALVSLQSLPKTIFNHNFLYLDVGKYARLSLG